MDPLRLQPGVGMVSATDLKILRIALKIVLLPLAPQLRRWGKVLSR
jgi:hypothetical protein